jgi:hypothetical protein
MDVDRLVLLLAERVREIATRQENIPFLTGDLRKSVVVHFMGNGKAAVGSNLPYARAVHDGRPAIVIRPNLSKNPRDAKKARLKFSIGGKTVYAKEVRQPARKGKPFLANAIKEMQRDGYPWLREELRREMLEEQIEDVLKGIRRSLRK